MSNSLDSDQAKLSVGPSLGPICVQTVRKGYQQTTQIAASRQSSFLGCFSLMVMGIVFICLSACILSGHSKRTPKIGFQYQLLLNAGQKYCRMLQGEHSAILSTFIELQFSTKTFVLSIFKWPLKTGFTVLMPHV